MDRTNVLLTLGGAWPQSFVNKFLEDYNEEHCFADQEPRQMMEDARGRHRVELEFNEFSQSAIAELDIMLEAAAKTSDVFALISHGDTETDGMLYLIAPPDKLPFLYSVIKGQDSCGISLNTLREAAKQGINLEELIEQMDRLIDGDCPLVPPFSIIEDQ